MFEHIKTFFVGFFVLCSFVSLLFGILELAFNFPDLLLVVVLGAIFLWGSYSIGEIIRELFENKKPKGS